MWNTPTVKFFKTILSIGKNSQGQGILEYVLILAVVISIFMVVGRPFLKDFGGKIQGLSQKGIFSEDSSGSSFYYFPLK